MLGGKANRYATVPTISSISKGPMNLGDSFPGLSNVKPEKNSIFLKNGKTVISVENRKFSRSPMTKRTALLNSSHEIW